MKKTVAKPKAKTLGKKTAAGKKPQSVLAKLSAKARAAAKGKKPAAKAGVKPTKGTAKAKAVALLNAKKVQTKVSKQEPLQEKELFTIFPIIYRLSRVLSEPAHARSAPMCTSVVQQR